VGIGPDWSLNPQGMKASWATSVIGLPVGVAQTCAQLLQPANAHLVWKRVDPEGPNTEAFMRQCLSQEPGRWVELTQDLGLRTGEFILFSRQGDPISAAAPSDLTRSAGLSGEQDKLFEGQTSSAADTP
jgi:hypothetical protein